MSDTMKAINNDLVKAFSTGVSYIVSTGLVGMLYLYVLIGPIGVAMRWLVSMLSDMRGGSGLVLGLILGAMAAFERE
ncbi:hypothetical protein [Sodalis sp. RH16]|uniref:hypothetical protein n=1 Tax=Sodalis sp. RH16 TaxID=3394331 RepID=UPI0039B39ABD